MPVSTISTFDAPDEYQAAWRPDAEVVLRVLEPGAFRAQLIRIALPHLSVTAGTEHLARIAAITVAPHLIRVSLPVRSGSYPVSGGTAYRPGELVTHGPGHRAAERTEGPCQWRTLWLSALAFAAYGRAVTGTALLMPAAEYRWRPKRSALRTLCSLHNDGTRLTTTHPNLATDTQAADGLAQQLILALIECLEGPLPRG